MSESATDSRPMVLSVSELNRQARVTIEHQFRITWVTGEISNFARPRSGHWYFTLKDERAQVRCAMFANRNRAAQIQPSDGQMVIVRGQVSLYEGRGDFQIIVDRIEPAGTGALQQAFDQLKIKLADEGLFEQQRKRQLPDYPIHCAVLTSATGAALKDVLSVWQRRYPLLAVTVVPCMVQGPEAEQSIIGALDQAADLHPDMILLTRGGGSLEDLWAFNLESVARHIAASPIPVVSAVGHEIDITISDFVADLRGPTPSAAAELITPDAREVAAAFAYYQERLFGILQRDIKVHSQTVTHLAARIPSPVRYLQQASQRLDDINNRGALALRNTLQDRKTRLHQLALRLRAMSPKHQIAQLQSHQHQLGTRLRRQIDKQIEQGQQRLSASSRMLEGVSPLPTLARGYAVLLNEQKQVVSATRQTQSGERLHIYLQDGRLDATVIETQPGHTLRDAIPDS